MAEPFIAEIVMFGGNFAPQGWAFCDGQLLPISQNAALFSLLGTTFGGDGRTTFALPDLRGRSPVHPGSGPGLTQIRLGQRSGAERHTLTTAQLPSHTHAAQALDGPGNANTAAGNVWSADAGNQSATYNTGNANADMGPTAIAPTGLNQAFDIRSPYLGINFIIALVGVFPSRN